MQETAGWYRRSPVRSSKSRARLVFSPFLFTPACFLFHFHPRSSCQHAHFSDRFATFSFTIVLPMLLPRLFERKAFLFRWTRFQSSINYDNSNYQIQYMGILQNYTDIFFFFRFILSLCFSYTASRVYDHYHLQNFSFPNFYLVFPFIIILSLSQLVLQFLLSSFHLSSIHSLNLIS